MGRGYLANVTVFPPRIFRFQYGPDMFSDKRSFKYNQVQAFGDISFDQTSAGAAAGGLLSVGAGLLKDVKEFSAILVATKPLEPVEGELRTITLEFQLDALASGTFDGGEPHGDIIPELDVLRSFVNPALEYEDIFKVLKGKQPCWNRPPECSFSYGGISLTCVMTDLNIKLTRFDESNGKPTRAEVSLTLKEQTFSVGTLSDSIKRYINIVKSYKLSEIKDVGKLAGDVIEVLNPFA